VEVLAVDRAVGFSISLKKISTVVPASPCTFRRVHPTLFWPKSKTYTRGLGLGHRDGRQLLRHADRLAALPDQRAGLRARSIARAASGRRPEIRRVPPGISLRAS
jgi:hypothetical protein